MSALCQKQTSASRSPSAFCDPGMMAFVINGLKFFLERNFFTLCNAVVSTMQSIGYQTDCLVPKVVINTASSFVRCGSTAGCAPAEEWEFALAEPTFDCRIYQRGAQWHWQVMNDFEHVLASGIAESDQAARNAAVLQCLQRLGNRSGSPMASRSDHHSDFELGQLALFGVATIVLLVFVWTL